MTARTVAVTGASGFIGRSVCAKLVGAGYQVRRIVRRAAHVNDLVVPDLSRLDSWASILDGVSAVVHLAALTHSGRNRDAAARDAYRAINVNATRRLAEQACSRGIESVVFMSSIKVNGESSVSPSGELYSYCPQDVPAPEDLYGKTKLEAEQCLFDTLKGSDVRLSVLRPPLVFGPGQKANMLSLMHIIRFGLPLPLGNVENQRSFIYVENLADAVLSSLERQRGQGCYTLADVTMSTPALITTFASAMDVKPRLFSMPDIGVRLLSLLPPLEQAISRIYGSLAVDSSLINEELGWVPKIDFSEGVATTVAWYRGLAQ